MTAQAAEAARFPDHKDLAGAQPGPGRTRAACLPGFTDRADGPAQPNLATPADIHRAAPCPALLPGLNAGVPAPEFS